MSYGPRDLLLCLKGLNQKKTTVLGGLRSVGLKGPPPVVERTCGVTLGLRVETGIVPSIHTAPTPRPLLQLRQTEPRAHTVGYLRLGFLFLSEILKSLFGM